MTLTLFSFGFSWAIYAFTFFVMARILPGFHSPYIQSTFTVAFIIGFVNALIIKAVRVMAFELPMAALAVAILGLDYLMIMGTNHSQIGYYITGHKSTLIAATALGVVAFITEIVKEYFRADVR